MPRDKTEVVKRFDTPPSPDEGEIAGVNHEARVTTALPDATRPCQACGESIYISQPHVRVGIKRYAEYGHRSGVARLCDKECWLDWATSD